MVSGLVVCEWGTCEREIQDIMITGKEGGVESTRHGLEAIYVNLLHSDQREKEKGDVSTYSLRNAQLPIPHQQFRNLIH